MKTSILTIIVCLTGDGLNTHYEELVGDLFWDRNVAELLMLRLNCFGTDYREIYHQALLCLLFMAIASEREKHRMIGLGILVVLTRMHNEETWQQVLFDVQQLLQLLSNN